MVEIILGSQSPRRKQLLELADLKCEVLVAAIDETPPSVIEAVDVPEYLAWEKAKAIQEKFPDLVKGKAIVTSDTIVYCEGMILGKPKDRLDAVHMLESLSGRIHEVITGVAIIYEGQEVIFKESVKVHFNELTADEIAYYVDTYQPYDKAGAYAIQEWIGAIGISKIEGDYYSVMGLPIQRVRKELLRLV